jgi:hypothetical protein
MNTRRLPRTLVVALGLGGCGDDDGGGGMTTTACLIAPLTDSASDSSTDSATGQSTGSATGQSTGSATGQSTGSATDTDTGDGSTFGPCLIAPPTTGTTSSDTDTDTDTDTGGDSTSAVRDAPPDHDTIVDELLDRGVLPPDVAAKLRNR